MWLISRVTKHTLHIVILILLTACVANHSVFTGLINFMLPLYVFNKLYAKCQVVLTLGQIKLTFGN